MAVSSMPNLQTLQVYSERDPLAVIIPFYTSVGPVFEGMTACSIQPIRGEAY
jgi:hypothetical protein